MIHFRRNLPVARKLSLLLVVYSFTVLYYLQWIFTFSGWQLIIGTSLIVLWAAVIIVRDVRLLVYDLDWIELSSEGICIKHFRRERMVFWNHICEAELRQAVGVRWDRAHPVHVVLSTIELTDKIRNWLCSDFAPWHFDEFLVEFDLQRQEKSLEISFQIEQHSKKYARAKSLFQSNGISIISKGDSIQKDYFQLLKAAKGACSFSMLRTLESFLWYMIVMLTEYELTQPVFLYENFLKGAWAITLLLSSVLFAWENIIKRTVVHLSI